MTAAEPRRSVFASLGDPAALAKILAIALGIILTAGCSPPPPAEQQILQTIDAMEAALEAGEVGDFMDPIAEDFIGGPGLDRRALGLFVRRERMARDRIAVSRFDTEVTLAGETRATATFRALATGGSGLLPDEGRLWSVETGWRLDEGDWRLISADWGASPGG